MRKSILLVFVLLFTLTACGEKTNNETNTETQDETPETLEETTNENNTETSDEDSSKNTESNPEQGENMKLNQIEGYIEGNIKGKIVTNHGEMDIILFPNVAPKAVENFVTHAKDGYYDGLIFHRVIEDFMIQGGDPTGTGMGGESIWGSSFEDEFDVNYRHFTGALSMANAGPNTNGSQFFIVTAKDNVGDEIISQMTELGVEQGYPQAVVDAYKTIGGTFHLDGKHTVFGQVVAGQEVAEAISKVEKDSNDKPNEDVVIEKIIIEE